jgi:predicted phosphohydrolase
MDFAVYQPITGKKNTDKGAITIIGGQAEKKWKISFMQISFDSLSILHNNCAVADGLVLCGTRGWMFEDGEAHDSKITAREEGRLRTSLQASEKHAGERVVFLHYPPI